MNEPIRSRRGALRLATAAALGAGALAGCAQTPHATANAGAPRRPLAFNDPVWNRETTARMEGNLDPAKFIHGSGSGVICAVREGQRVQPLMRYEIFSAWRVVRQPDNSYQRLCRELVFYRNLATGQLMDEWDNPLTGERVRVVDIANDPFNYVISEWYPDPPSYGGLNTQRPPRRPYIRNWSLLDEHTAVVEADIHLLYPSAMRPEQWPRESPGPMTRVSEMFRWFVRREDLENPDLNHIPTHGTWSRVTPWLPWMLMDQAPGHIMYMGQAQLTATMATIKADVVERVRQRYPKYLTAPQRWEDPSLSSLERYAREQKPAPPRAR